MRAFARLAAATLLLAAASPLGAMLDPRELQPEIAGIVRSTGAEAEDWSVVVYDLGGRRFLAQSNELRAYPPGQAAGLFTALAVMEALPEGHRFRTELWAEGSVDERGRWQGDLWLVGGGDPALGSGRFDRRHRPLQTFAPMAEALRERGIRRVEGDLIAHAGAVPREPSPPGWSERMRGTPRHPVVSGLVFGDGGPVVEFRTVRRFVFWRRVATRVSPEVGDLGFEGRPRIGPAGEPADVRWFRDSGRLVVDGAIPRGGRVSTRPVLDDPVEYAAFVLEESLRRRGVRIQGEARRASRSEEFPPNAQFIAAIESRPLDEILAAGLRDAEPLYAEVLARMAAGEAGSGPTAEGVADLLRDHAERTGLADRAWLLLDASGLSRLNRASARSMALAAAELLRDERGGRLADAVFVQGEGTARFPASPPMDGPEVLVVDAGRDRLVVVVAGPSNAPAGRQAEIASRVVDLLRFGPAPPAPEPEPAPDAAPPPAESRTY